MKKSKANKYIHLLFILFPFVSLFASANDTLFLSSEELKEGKIYISESWRYHQGDDMEWASPTFDDSNWDTLKPMMWMNECGIRDWQGIGWFRKVIRIDSSMLNREYWH